MKKRHQAGRANCCIQKHIIELYEIESLMDATQQARDNIRQ